MPKIHNCFSKQDGVRLLDVAIATRHQHHRPRLDLRADRLRLCVDYRVSRVLNLAHGELMMLGAYLLLATASMFSASPALAIAAAILLSATVGLLVYALLMRRMTGEMVLAAILTTVALGILMRGVLVLIWSSQQQYPAQALHVTNPTLAIGQRSHFVLVAWSWCLTTSRVYWALLLSSLRPLGHAHARCRPEPAAGSAARN